MMEFEKQSEIMDMKEEMMEDAIDDAMGDEEDEEEGDKIVQQVLDELGLDLGDKLNGSFYFMRVWYAYGTRVCILRILRAAVRGGQNSRKHGGAPQVPLTTNHGAFKRFTILMPEYAGSPRRVFN